MPIQIPFELPAAPYLKDHQFNGRPVLPAVEAMELLTGAVLKKTPDIDPYAIRAARFDKFLPLDQGAELELWGELEVAEEIAGVRAVLKSKRRGKRGIARTFTHASMRFGADRGASAAVEKRALEPPDAFVPPAPERIYTELVPFGPAYRNIVAITAIDRGSIRVEIVPPDLGGPFRLGSPFVLDAAFHAACVWGQRYAGVVAFPVGFEQRRILTPCQAGKRYEAHIRVAEQGAAMLSFDIAIENREQLCEVVKSVGMRDVSGGRLKPPGWLAADSGAEA